MKMENSKAMPKTTTTHTYKMQEVMKPCVHKRDLGWGAIFVKTECGNKFNVLPPDDWIAWKYCPFCCRSIKGVEVES